MSSVTTYNPQEVIVIFGGFPLSGFAKDGIIEVKPSGEGTKKYVGCDGEVGRSIDPDATLEVKLELAQTSASNDYLTDCYKADQDAGSGMKELIIKDLSGTTLIHASQAWVANLPQAKDGKEIEKFEWTLETGQASAYIGGND